MKKLLCSAAVVGLALAATPAKASDGVKLDLGGFFKGYGMYTNQDDDSAAADSRNFDIIRNTEVHFGGETTLDNGLTVGMHVEADADTGDGFGIDESYAYMSGGWGRVNFGGEDGAAYLLQVEAPSADANLDGLRQDVNPINYANLQTGAAVTDNVLTALNVNGSVGGLDYDQDISGSSDKLTYLSPIMNGFQVGVSYTPDVAEASSEDAANEDDADDTLGAGWDVAARYEGQFNNVGVILGAGYSSVDLESSNAQAGADNFSDDRTAWNVGADFDIGPFGIGAAYMVDDYGSDPVSATQERDDEETWVVGADYTTGPFKLGVSYMDVNNVANIDGTDSDVTKGVDAQRWTGGVIYTYGPGMTFRGSVSNVDFDHVDALTTGDSVDATSVLLGTQIDF